MKQKINFILNTNFFKKAVQFYLFIFLIFSVLNGAKAQADSTFFPEDENLTETRAEPSETDASSAIKKWAELNPPQQKTETLAPPPKEEHAETKALEPQSLAPEPVKAEQPLQNASIVSPSDRPSVEKQQPLQLTAVQPHPKPQPILEKEQTSLAQQTPQPPQKSISYEDAANNRAPLASLEPTQEVHNQRWFLYAAAIRGLKNPSDVVHIVTMQGCAPHRGEEIKKSLVDDDIAKEKIEIIHAKGEPHQTGFTYIFAGK